MRIFSTTYWLSIYCGSTIIKRISLYKIALQQLQLQTDLFYLILVKSCFYREKKNMFQSQLLHHDIQSKWKRRTIAQTIWNIFFFVISSTFWLIGSILHWNEYKLRRISTHANLKFIQKKTSRYDHHKFCGDIDTVDGIESSKNGRRKRENEMTDGGKGENS